MASRKQRRRRQKERRHDYEFVYVDEEGREVDVDPAELEKTSKHETRRNGSKRPSGKSGGRDRPVRKIDPPSWKRVGKRALILAPLILIAFSLLNHKQPIATRVLLTVLYTGFFVPFMYLMDRAMYRSYLRRTGQAPPSRTGLRR